MRSSRYAYFFRIVCRLYIMSKKRLTAYFLLYNFIGSAVAIGGWLWEALIYLITEHRFVNRGFFYGPYLPVYGAGAVLLSVIFYQKRIAVIITYAHLNRTDYPQEFYHSRLYARLRRLLDLSRRILHARLQGLPSRRLLHTKLRRLPSQRPLPARLQNQPRLKQRKQIRNSLKRRYQHAAQDIRIFFLSLCGGCLTEFAAGWLLWPEILGLQQLSTQSGWICVCILSSRIWRFRGNLVQMGWPFFDSYMGKNSVFCANSDYRAG